MTSEIKFVDLAVRVLGRTHINQVALDEFLLAHGLTWESDSEIGAEVVSEVAGRVCYMSFGKPRPGGNMAYLENIKKSGHGSVLEHPTWSLVFTGISRSLTHEFVRHRAGWAYSQLSQRYVDESVAEYVVPPALKDAVFLAQEFLKEQSTSVVEDVMQIVSRMAQRDQFADFGGNLGRMYRFVEAGIEFMNQMKSAHTSYCKLGTFLATEAPQELEPTEKRKWARSAARSVLPNATETKIVATANARAWRHFLEMRASRGADVEIRAAAMQAFLLLVSDAPNLFGDYNVIKLPDGTEALDTPYRKV